jgi:hypothetical protein
MSKIAFCNETITIEVVNGSMVDALLFRQLHDFWLFLAASFIL